MNAVDTVREVEALIRRLGELVTSLVGEMSGSEEELEAAVMNTLDVLARLGMPLFQGRLLPAEESMVFGVCVPLGIDQVVLTSEGQLGGFAGYKPNAAAPSDFLRGRISSIHTRTDKGIALVGAISGLYADAFSKIEGRSAATRARYQAFQQVMRVLSSIG